MCRTEVGLASLNKSYAGRGENDEILKEKLFSPRYIMLSLLFPRLVVFFFFRGNDFYCVLCKFFSLISSDEEFFYC